jgi:hypothetical protein
MRMLVPHFRWDKNTYAGRDWDSLEEEGRRSRTIVEEVETAEQTRRQHSDSTLRDIGTLYAPVDNRRT